MTARADDTVHSVFVALAVYIQIASKRERESAHTRDSSWGNSWIALSLSLRTRARAADKERTLSQRALSLS